MITKGMFVTKDTLLLLLSKLLQLKSLLKSFPIKYIVQFESTDIFTVAEQHRKASGFPLAPCCKYTSASVTPLPISRPRKSTNRTQPQYSS